MKVTLPNDWIVSDDSSAHFAAAEADDPDYRVLFSLDAYAVRRGNRAKGVPSTTEGILAWLRANQNVRVMPKPERPIGTNLHARVVDISISDKAVNDDPGCPEDVCVNPIAFPPSGEVYGLAGDGVIRLYLSDIRYQERKQLLVISIEGKDRADLNSFLPGAERLIASVQAPVIPE